MQRQGTFRNEAEKEKGFTLGFASEPLLEPRASTRGGGRSQIQAVETSTSHVGGSHLLSALFEQVNVASPLLNFMWPRFESGRHSIKVSSQCVQCRLVLPVVAFELECSVAGARYCVSPMVVVGGLERVVSQLLQLLENHLHRRQTDSRHWGSFGVEISDFT